jgi:predicted CoA-binding protein
MTHDSYADDNIRGILNTVKSIAMVGISPRDNRPSYFAFKDLLERGYRMIPVNPGQTGKDILGRKVYARLADIPEPVDVVDVFRASQHAPAVVADALAMQPRPAMIWMQLASRTSIELSDSCNCSCPITMPSVARLILATDAALRFFKSTLRGIVFFPKPRCRRCITQYSAIRDQPLRSLKSITSSSASPSQSAGSRPRRALAGTIRPVGGSAAVATAIGPFLMERSQC